jgi:hypothetical protein
MGLEEDRELLEEALDSEVLRPAVKEAFDDMLAKLDRFGRPLTPAQKTWVQAAISGDRYEPEETYKNEFSSGKIPVGEPVVLNVGPLPKRPPGRR